MVVTKQTKEYVISLTKQALVALKNNQFETAEDLLRSAKGELHDANMDMPHMSVNAGFDVVSSHKKLKFL
jgi:hypothetical protein